MTSHAPTSATHSEVVYTRIQSNTIHGYSMTSHAPTSATHSEVVYTRIQSNTIHGYSMTSHAPTSATHSEVELSHGICWQAGLIRHKPGRCIVECYYMKSQRHATEV